MKKIFLSILFLLFCFILNAQNTDNKPSRAVLYQMSDNEALSLRFLHSEKSKEGIRFAAVTYDFVEKSYNFVMNGKVIRTIKSVTENYLPFGFFYLDVQESNGYGFIYREADKANMNIKGKIVENVEMPIKLILKTDKFAFTYLKDNQYFVCINGKSLGPYSQINDLKYTASGKFIYNYYDDNKKLWYVNMSNTIYGPYSNVFGIDISETGNFVFSLKDEAGFNCINFNGKVLGPYQAVAFPVKIASANIYAYAYRNNDQWILNVSGKTMKDFANAGIIEDVFVDAAGKWAIKYQQNSRTNYVINSITSDENTFSRLNPEKKIKNAFVFGYSQDINITNTNGLHKLNSSVKTNQVTIDDKKYGNAYAVNAYFDSSTNSFIWVTAEKNKLIRYELKL